MRVQKTETKKAGKSSIKAETIFNALITNNERMNQEKTNPVIVQTESQRVQKRPGEDGLGSGGEGDDIDEEENPSNTTGAMTDNN